MKNKEVELKYYPRTENYMIRIPGEGYLRCDVNTGAVQTITDAKKATYIDSKEDAIELIKWYFEGTPVETEKLAYAVPSEED